MTTAIPGLGLPERTFVKLCGYAYTTLGSTTDAERHHGQALTLYPEDEYRERVLIRLDLARGMAVEGDASEACRHATNIISGHPADQRSRSGRPT